MSIEGDMCKTSGCPLHCLPAGRDFDISTKIRMFGTFYEVIDDTAISLYIRKTKLQMFGVFYDVVDDITISMCRDFGIYSTDETSNIRYLLRSRR